MEYIVICLLNSFVFINLSCDLNIQKLSFLLALFINNLYKLMDSSSFIFVFIIINLLKILFFIMNLHTHILTHLTIIPVIFLFASYLFLTF